MLASKAGTAVSLHIGMKLFLCSVVTPLGKTCLQDLDMHIHLNVQVMMYVCYLCIYPAAEPTKQVSWAALASKGTSSGTNPAPMKPQATVKPEVKPEVPPAADPLPQRFV